MTICSKLMTIYMRGGITTSGKTPTSQSSGSTDSMLRLRGHVPSMRSHSQVLRQSMTTKQLILVKPSWSQGKLRSHLIV